MVAESPDKVTWRAHVGVVADAVAPGELLEEGVGGLLDEKEIVAAHGVGDVGPVVLVP